jgi:hypothetical protein
MNQNDGISYGRKINNVMNYNNNFNKQNFNVDKRKRRNFNKGNNGFNNEAENGLYNFEPSNFNIEQRKNQIYNFNRNNIGCNNFMSSNNNSNSNSLYSNGKISMDMKSNFILDKFFVLFFSMNYLNTNDFHEI